MKRTKIISLLIILVIIILACAAASCFGAPNEPAGKPEDTPSEQPGDDPGAEVPDAPDVPELPDVPDVCTHEYGEWHESTVTCTLDGQVGHYECLKCHKIFDANYRELFNKIGLATGHKGGVATCTESGICAICGVGYLPPLGHLFEVTDASVIGEDGKATLTCSRDASHTACMEVFRFSMQTKESYSLTANAVNDFIAMAQSYDEDDFSYTYVTDAAQSPSALKVIVQFSQEKNNAVRCTVAPKQILLEISKNADMSDALTYTAKASDTSLAVENLETGATYYARASLIFADDVRIPTPVTSFRTEPGVRPLHISKVANARDLGGWVTEDGSVVKQGLVIRSGKLDSISEEGKRFLLDVIGVKTELDLRSDQNLIDIDGNADRTESFLGSSVNYIRVSGTQGKTFFSSYGAALEAMLVFANPDNYPIVVHCAAGADRTGALCLALMGLLGVSENNAVADYELTYQRYRNPDNPKMPEYYCSCAEFLTTLHGLEGDSFGEKMTKFFDETCGMTAMELSNIKNLMLTDSAVFLADSLGPNRKDRNVFHLDLRSCGGIKSVTLDGEAADYSFDEASSTLTVNNTLAKGAHFGTIVFADGESLGFEIRK